MNFPEESFFGAGEDKGGRDGGRNAGLPPVDCLGMVGRNGMAIAMPMQEPFR